MATKAKNSNAVPQLSSFEGRDVMQSTIAITKAGDGLSKSVAVEPQEFHHGETVYVLIETEVTDVRYQEIAGTGTLRRVQTLATVLATIVDHEFADATLESQRIKIEEAKGVTRLPLGDGVIDVGASDE